MAGRNKQLLSNDPAINAVKTDFLAFDPGMRQHNKITSFFF